MKGHTMPFCFYSACGVRDPKVLLEQGLWQKKAVCFIKPTDVIEKKNNRSSQTQSVFRSETEETKLEKLVLFLYHPAR